MEANTHCKDVRMSCSSCLYCIKCGSGTVCIYNPPRPSTIKPGLLDCGRHPAVFAHEFCHHFKDRGEEGGRANVR